MMNIISLRKFFLHWTFCKLSPTYCPLLRHQCLQSVTVSHRKINKQFESLRSSQLHLQSIFLLVFKIIYRNSVSYYRLLLQLSRTQGHFLTIRNQTIYLNIEDYIINSLLLKTDEHKHIAKLTNAAVIQIQTVSCLQHGTIIQTGITCKKLSCYMRY